VPQRETVPDEVVRGAEQVELVDMTAEALRRRMAHGNIYAPEKIDAALGNYFRVGNLAALRELALLWVADKVDDSLEEYRARHGIHETWETRERVMVALTGAPGGEQLIRRAARIARRAHGDLVGVHVRSDEGLSVPDTGLLARHRRLLDELGGEYQEVVGSDIARGLVEAAQAANATQLVLGASRRSRWNELTRGSVINRVVRMSDTIDIHVISHEPTPEERALPFRPSARLVRLPPRRQLWGWGIAGLGLPLLTVLLANVRGHVGLPGVLLLYLLLVVATAAVGGAAPAIAAAVAGFLLANWFFTPPLYRFTISEFQNVLALAVFLVVGAVVSGLVDAAARRGSEAARARAEAETLARLAATMGEDDPLSTLVEHLRTTFSLHGVSVLARGGGDDDGGGNPWTIEAAAGSHVPERPESADTVERLGHGTVLALRGRTLASEDLLVLHAFAAQLGAAIERQRLRNEAGRATALAEANDLRTALLQAVSHDLRTPLASIKASVSSLRQGDLEWSKEETELFLATIEEETDRLTRLVTNLLDMSRLQAGAMKPVTRAVGLEEIVPEALAGLGPRARLVQTDLPETLPQVVTDPALLERVVANLVDNALRSSPNGDPVRVEAGAVAGHLDLRVVDRGGGIPTAERERVFQPFQRLGDDGGANTGVGLGLAVARGLVEAVSGELSIEDTPGGGTTMVVSLPYR
jgi:two-component system sensor histidine kinase KdpD